MSEDPTLKVSRFRLRPISLRNRLNRRPRIADNQCRRAGKCIKTIPTGIEQDTRVVRFTVPKADEG